MTGAETQLLPIASNLGVAGFAIWILWKMFDSNQREREDNNLYIRGLEKEVRDKVLTQLAENTKAFERIMEHFQEHERNMRL